nr:ABC transporter permease [uncultured Schaedlerella sp.]
MNIFHKIALEGLKKNRTRTLVTIIGVVLSTVMITGVTTFGVSLLDYMARGAIQKYGGWGAAFLNVDASFVQERSKDKEVTDTVTFENIGYAEAKNGTDPGRPYLFIAGFQEETFQALPITLLSGRLPEHDGEVLVSGSAMKECGISGKTGSTLELFVGSRMRGEQELSQADPYEAGAETFLPRKEKTYTVVGICRTPVFENEESPGCTLITKTDAEAGYNPLTLFVTLDQMRKVYSYTDQVKAGYPCILNYDVLRIMGISDRPSDKVFMAFLYSFGGIVLAIIMIGSVFLIYNSFSISLSERIREIGVLASVGATEKQLRNSVLFEGLCIGMAGIPIGILAGLGCIRGVISVVSGRFGAVLYTGVPLTTKVSLPAVAGATAVSLVTILISAWLPAKKAVSLPVMECIRQTNEIKVESGAMEIPQRKQRMYGLEGTLALKNFKRNRKRYRSIVLSLVLSIVLFVSANALIESMQQSADGLKTVSDYDIGFGTQEMEDEELFRLYDKMKAISGISESSCRAVIAFSSRVSPDQLTDAYREAAGGGSAQEDQELLLEVHFFDDAFYQKLVKRLGLPAAEYMGQNGKMLAVAKINDDSDDVKGAEDLADLFQSASVELAISPKMTDGTTGQEQNVTITPAEFIPPDIPPFVDAAGQETLPYTLEIIAPWSVKETLVPSDVPAELRVKGMCFNTENASQAVEKMRRIIIEEGISCSYTLINSSEAFEQYRNYLFIANVFAWLFIALISLIAAANVFNTISTNIKLRRRELAMLRSVGMSDKDFNKMIRFECAFYGIKALAIGIPLSLLSSVLIVKTMSTDGTAFILPWAGIGISVLSVFLVIFVTMMYAVSKIRKENIIDALRDEMT